MSYELIGVVVAVVVQTGALFYWGGKLTTEVKDHGRRLSGVEGKLDRHIELHDH